MEMTEARQTRAGWDGETLAKLLLVITFVAYLPALRGGFVFDDVPLIVMNRLVRAPDGLFRLWFSTQAADYYPLTGSLWWIEWRLWGYHAIGYHTVNILLHAADALLLWKILERLKVRGAWLAALVFAIHPVNVATAAWISEQKNTLSMLFFAATILFYLRFYEEKRWRWYSYSLVMFLLGMFSKSAIVMTPVVLLGCVWWTEQKLRWKDWFRIAPFFAISFGLGLLTIWFQHYRAMEGHAIRNDGFLVRAVAAGWIPWFYLYKALLPVNLCVIYPRWQIDASRWISFLPGVLLIVCFFILWWKRNEWGRPLLLGLGYYVVMLFPVLGFVDQGFYAYSPVADHWQYYSIIGVIAVVAATSENLSGRIGNPFRRWGTAATVALLALLFAGTWRRSSIYATDEALWQDTVDKNPLAWSADMNLGLALAQAGKLDAAMKCYARVLTIKPDLAEAHNGLGDALRQMGRTKEAVSEFEQAIRMRADYAEPHGNLGTILAQQGRDSEAVAQYEEALRIKPDFYQVYNNLGNELLKQGKAAEAIECYQKALGINPDLPEARRNLEIALRPGTDPQK